ncbi:MAG: hypothetical protein GY757_35120 [bacterium]|nr:hypothetical protein [bacterium]
MNIPGENHSLSDNNPRVLYRDLSGTLWVGTYDGLNRYNPSDGSFQRYLYKEKIAKKKNGSINCITEDSSRDLWVGTSNPACSTHGISDLQPAGDAGTDC